MSDDVRLDLLKDAISESGLDGQTKDALADDLRYAQTINGTDNEALQGIKRLVIGGIRRELLAHDRTSLRHVGCISNGCWECCGAPRQVTAYAIDKCVWPHRCTGCGATNEIYDARWPKIEMKWEAAK